MKKILKKLVAYILVSCELFQATGVYALTKDENVYVKLNENGEVQSASVTEHLSDYDGSIINDKTILSNIKNINGNEKFNLKDNDLVWETSGNDIYYQGTYDKNLPVSLDVKYYLNGEEKTVKEILGKKGNIKIVLSYKNNSYKNMNINGRIEKMYVPYGVVTTTILNNSNNKNIKVTNGKVIDNGVGSVIMAISSPGLYESLKLNDLNSIDKVEITYDTDSFELSSIYSVASTSLFNNYNLDVFSRLNDLYGNINLLQSNMDTIVSSSKKLNDGTSQLNDGITELNSRIQELTKKYKYYRNQDKDTIKEELINIVDANINAIVPELEEEITNETSKIIKENKEELENAVITYTKDNTKKVVEEEVNRIVLQLDIDRLIEDSINNNLYNILKNNTEVIELTKILKKDINTELRSIIANEFNQICNNMNNNMIEIQNEDVNYIVEKYGLTEEEALEIVNKVQTDTLNQAKKNISDENISDRIINELNNKNYVSNLVNNYVTKLNELINSDTTISDYSKEIKDNIILAIKKEIDEGKIDLDVNNYISGLVDKIIDNTAKELSSKYTEEYTNRVVNNIIQKQFSEENVDSKLRELLDIYENDIDEKVNELDNSINTLSDSLNKLKNGSDQIASGMSILSNGLDKYNVEGINRINNLVNGDVKTFQKRIDALSKLSNENRILDSSPAGAANSSKIIFMIDSVSKTSDTKSSEIEEDKKSSFWSKLKNLFV